MASIELKHYTTPSGVKTAIIRVSGPKWMQVLMMEGALTVRKIPKSETRFMEPLLFKGRPYPLRRAIHVFRHYGRASGINKSAKALLRDATKQTESDLHPSINRFMFYNNCTQGDS